MRNSELKSHVIVSLAAAMAAGTAEEALELPEIQSRYLCRLSNINQFKFHKIKPHGIEIGRTTSSFTTMYINISKLYILFINIYDLLPFN